MSENQNTDSETTVQQNDLAAQFLEALTKEVPVVYANDSSITVGNEDVTIAFGFSESGVGQTKYSTRIVMTHSSFVHMMEFWQKRVTLLRTLYQENPIGFMETRTDTSIIEKAFEEMNRG